MVTEFHPGIKVYFKQEVIMDKIKVTIFTLAYNAEDYIAKTIESVLNQTETNFEYVIRDNGSTDGTYKILKSYAAKDARIKLLQNQVNHKNDDGTIMEFYEYCPMINGEYWTMLDSDDLLEKSYIKEMYQAAKGADIVISGTTFFLDKSEKTVGERHPLLLNYKKGEKISAKELCTLYGCLRPLWGKLYRTRFYRTHIEQMTKESKRFEAGGDTAMSVYLLKKAESVVCLPKPLHRYRIRETSHYTQTLPKKTRIQDGERLLQRGIELAEFICTTPELAKPFFYCVFISHLTDLAKMCFKSEEMTTEQVIEYCEMLMNNAYLAYIRRKMEQSLEVKQSFIRMGNYLYKGYQDIIMQQGITQSLQSWSVRLFMGLCSEEYPAGVRFLLWQSGVFDENNVHSFGIELDHTAYGYEDVSTWLKEYLAEYPMTRKAMAGAPELQKYYLSSRANVDLSKEKISMLDGADAGNWAKVAGYVKQILTATPIDLEAYYFGIMAAYYINNKKELKVLSYLAEMFYPENPDIHDLLCQISRRTA